MVAFLMAALVLGQAGDAKKALEQFQGKWKVTSSTTSGKKAADEAIKDLFVTFSGTDYTLPGSKGFTGSDKGTIKIDGSKKPGQIDLMPADGPNKGKTIQGIYEIDGDTMKACYDTTGKSRPTAFESKADSGLILITYKREKK